MNENEYNERLKPGLKRAFYNRRGAAYETWTPSFVYNDAKHGQKVYCTIEEELKNCTSFWFSVAFITQAGVQLLKAILKELEKKGIYGRILTTNYLFFSDPSALEFLSSFSNIELRMYRCEEDNPGFHTKGYCFQNENGTRMLIGSSNLTGPALTVNEEWNARLISSRDGEFIEHLTKRFDALFQDPHTVPYSSYREEYRLQWEWKQKQKEVISRQKRTSTDPYKLQPNKMQIQFIQNLRQLIDAGKKKALLVSATGTGKLYPTRVMKNPKIDPKPSRSA